MDPTAELIARLDLAPHPEGGFYRELHRSALATHILFLLPPGVRSRLHRVRGREELWHHYEGGPLDLHVLDGRGWRSHRLDPADRFGVVPPDAWQAAEAVGPGPTLVGCTVAPPFEFSAFDLVDRRELTAEFPGYADRIARFS